MPNNFPPGFVPDQSQGQQLPPGFVPDAGHAQAAPQPAQAQSQSSAPPAYGFEPMNLLKNAFSGVAGAVGGAYGLAHDFSTMPIAGDIHMQNGMVAVDPKSFLGKDIAAPAIQQENIAKQQWTQPGLASKVSAAGHELASYIPFLGPWAAGLGEQVGKGDIGGAIAQGAGGYGTMKAAEAATPNWSAISDFINRTKELQPLKSGLTAVLQGKLMPQVNMLDAKMRLSVDDSVSQIVAKDKAGALPGRPTITMPQTAQALSNYHRFNPNAQTEALTDRIQTAIQGIDPQTKQPLNFEGAKLLRSDIGQAAARARASGNAQMAGYLTSLYDAMSDDMQHRAVVELGLKDDFNRYLKNSRAYFDLRSNKVFGDLLESRPIQGLPPAQQAYRVLTGEDEAVRKATGLGSTASNYLKLKPSERAKYGGDLRQVRQAIQDSGMDTDQWDDAVRQTRVLTDAYKIKQKGYVGSLYNIAASGISKPALLGLGTLLAMHGVAGGFAPYLMAMMVTAAATKLQPEIKAGGAIRELKGQVHPEAWNAMEQPDFSKPNRPAASSPLTNPHPSLMAYGARLVGNMRSGAMSKVDIDMKLQNDAAQELFNKDWNELKPDEQKQARAAIGPLYARGAEPLTRKMTENMPRSGDKAAQVKAARRGK